MAKKLSTMLCIVLFIVLALMIWHDKKTGNEKSAVYKEMSARTRALSLQVYDLKQQITDLESEALAEQAGTATTQFLITDLSARSLSEIISPLTDYGYPAGLALSLSEFPGAEGCLTADEAAALAQQGWYFCYAYDADEAAALLKAQNPSADQAALDNTRTDGEAANAETASETPEPQTDSGANETSDMSGTASSAEVSDTLADGETSKTSDMSGTASSAEVSDTLADGEVNETSDMSGTASSTEVSDTLTDGETGEISDTSGTAASTEVSDTLTDAEAAEALSLWLTAVEEAASAQGLEMAPAVYFPSGTFREGFAETLKAQGIRTVIHHGELGAGLLDADEEDGLWYAGAAWWRSNEVLSSKLSAISADGGELATLMGIDGSASDSLDSWMKRFESIIDGKSIEVTDFSGMVEIQEENASLKNGTSENPETSKDAEVAELEAQIEELEAQIEEIQDKYLDQIRNLDQ